MVVIIKQRSLCQLFNQVEHSWQRIVRQFSISLPAITVVRLPLVVIALGQELTVVNDSFRPRAVIDFRPLSWRTLQTR